MIVSVMMVLFLSIALSAALIRSQIQLRESQVRLASQQAFYAAEAGVQTAIFQLRKDSSWRPAVGTPPAAVRVTADNGSTLVGFYQLEMADADDYNGFPSLWVKSTGMDIDQGTPRAVLARAVVQNPEAFLLSTAGNLRINSGAVFDNDILGKDVFFDVVGNQPITVDGDVFYINTITNETNPAVHIVGTNEHGEAHQARKFPTVTFAGVDTERYRKLARDQGGFYQEGNLVINGNIDKASLSYSNGLVFAEGDIYIRGDIRESMLIVAGGNVYIDGDVKMGIPVDPQARKPQLGIMASKDVLIPENAPNNISIEAFVMADGQAGSNGIFEAKGPKGTKGNLTFTGSMAMRGRNNVRTAVDLNVYSNRVYNLNNEMQVGNLIPFLPFIANVACSQEVNPPDSIASYAGFCT